MKLIMLLFLILKVTFSTAGSFPNMVVSTVDAGWISDANIILPTAGQGFKVFVPAAYFSCSYQSDIFVDIKNNNIKVFVERDSSVCADPIPPIYGPITEIGGLAEGSYNLSSYYVPLGDDFPPAAADYPSYFLEDIQFEVLGSPAIIDSTTNSGLALLILLLFITGFYFRKQNFSQ